MLRSVNKELLVAPKYNLWSISSPLESALFLWLLLHSGTIFQPELELQLVWTCLRVVLRLFSHICFYDHFICDVIFFYISFSNVVKCYWLISRNGTIQIMMMMMIIVIIYYVICICRFLCSVQLHGGIISISPPATYCRSTLLTLRISPAAKLWYEKHLLIAYIYIVFID